MFLSFKLPVKFMFENLNIVWLYPMYNATLSCLGVVIITGLKNQTVTRVKVALVGLCSLIIGVIVLYIGSNTDVLVNYLSFLLISLLSSWHMLQCIEMPSTFLKIFPKMEKVLILMMEKDKKPEGFLSGTHGTSGDVRNELGESKTEYISSSYNKFNCPFCAQSGAGITVLYGKHCRVCAQGRYADGTPAQRRPITEAFKAQREDYVKSHPEARKALEVAELAESKQVAPVTEGQASSSKDAVSQTQPSPSVPKYIPPHKREGG